MKEEKFKIIQYIRELIISIDNNLENFPKKDIELKNRLRSNSYDILEVVYKANTIKDKSKKLDLLYDLIAKLKVIDFLTCATRMLRASMTMTIVVWLQFAP